MDHNPQQEFEALFEKLEPWQQQWVECRAAVRVLPAISTIRSRRPWRSPITIISAVAQLPWLAVLGSIDEALYEKLKPTCRDVEKAANAADSWGFPNQANVAYASLAVAKSESDHLDLASFYGANALSAVADQATRNDFYACAIEDANHLIRQYGPVEFESVHIPESEFEKFLCRRLWEPIQKWSEAWHAVVENFSQTVSKLNESELADFYAVLCDGTADLAHIHEWVKKERPSPVDSHERAELSESDNHAPTRSQVEPVELTSDDSWWIDLLYRLDLDDLGRTRVSVEPSLGTFEGAVRRSLEGESAAATSGLSKGGRSSQPSSESSSKEKVPVRASEVAAVAERLESLYGHLPAPPPLWRAWFQAVHGDRLRKIQEHFARGAE